MTAAGRYGSALAAPAVDARVQQKQGATDANVVRAPCCELVLYALPAPVWHAVTAILLNISPGRTCSWSRCLASRPQPLLLAGCRLVWPAGVAGYFLLVYLHARTTFNLVAPTPQRQPSYCSSGRGFKWYEAGVGSRVVVKVALILYSNGPW